MSSVQWVSFAMILAVLFDLYFIWVWRRYRQFHQTQRESGEEAQIPQYQLLWRAMRLKAFLRVKAWLSAWKGKNMHQEKESSENEEDLRDLSR